MAKRFETLDANGDGAVARAKFDAMAAGRFQRFDADGVVTRDELQSPGRRGG